MDMWYIASPVRAHARRDRRDLPDDAVCAVPAEECAPGESGTRRVCNSGMSIVQCMAKGRVYQHG